MIQPVDDVGEALYYLPLLQIFFPFSSECLLYFFKAKSQPMHSDIKCKSKKYLNEMNED